MTADEIIRNRVCIWGDNETTRGVFSYYSGITLPMVREPSRVAAILKKEDPDFDLIVLHRLDEFEVDNPAVPEWKAVARAKKGRQRVFYLITGE